MHNQPLISFDGEKATNQSTSMPYVHFESMTT